MTCFRFLAIIDLQNRFNTKAKITRIRLNNMKKPRSIPIICWTNIIINYLIVLGLTLIVLALGDSFIQSSALLFMPYLNFVVIFFLNKNILRGRHWARDIFIAWLLAVDVLVYVLFENIPITMGHVLLLIVNLICLFHPSANVFFHSKNTE